MPTPTDRDVGSPSSRRVTRDSGTFTRETTGSCSLGRGLQILRAFRPGAALLGNAELAARTKLPRPTVSRLTRSLVDGGFLDYDIAERGYRLAPVFLSLADAFRQSDSASEAAFPLMRHLAEQEHVNVGLALPNLLEMVYVESLRESRRGVFRRAVPGSRFPMELTSGGRAYLAALGTIKRQNLLKEIGDKYGIHWDPILREIEDSVSEISRLGYCAAHWQPGMTAVGTPLPAPNGKLYSLNISFHSAETLAESIPRYGCLLLELKDRIATRWSEKENL